MEKDDTKLRHLAEFIIELKEAVREKYLSGTKIPEWFLPKDHFKNRAGRLLQNAYQNHSERSNEFLKQIFPKSFFLAIAVLLVVLLDILYLVLFATNPIFGVTTNAVDEKILLASISCFLIALILFSSIGAYWTIFEVAINKKVSRNIRFLVIITSIIFVVIWVGNGSPKIWQIASYEDGIPFKNYVISLAGCRRDKLNSPV